MVGDARSGIPDAFGDRGMERYKQQAWSSFEDPRTEREKWEQMRDEAEALVRSVRGTFAGPFEDDGYDERRQIVAEQIERSNGDPLLYRAVTQPNAAPPPVTLADAVGVYQRERLGENPKRSARNTFNKIKRRL
jgi:hypothetical protein